MAVKTKASKAKEAPAEAATESEDELEDLEETEEGDAKAKVAANQPEPTFGTKQLGELIKQLTGKEYSGRDLRTLIRKMHRDGELTGREISRDNPIRYSWTGADDPEVKAIVKKVKAGSIESARSEALADLKEKGKAKREAKRAAKEKAKAESLGDDEDEEEAETEE